MESARGSFNIGTQQETFTRTNYQHQDSERATSTNIKKGQTFQHIKTDRQSVPEGVICRRPRKGVGLSLTVQKGVTTSLDAQKSRHRTSARGLPDRQPSSQYRLLQCPARSPKVNCQLTLLQRASSAAICPGSTRAGALRIPVRALIGSRPSARPGATT